VVRIYEDPGRGPGQHRVLVDRLWPRGVARSRLDIDAWLRDVAPSTSLRRWYAHDPERFFDFAQRYRAELREEPASSALCELRAHLRRGLDVVLLTATRDVEHSAAQVLAEVLRAQP
jgi:uncharacterized protein YeaO (DUF488 family)